MFFFIICFFRAWSFVDAQITTSQQFATLSRFNLVNGGLYTGNYKSGSPNGEGNIVYFTDDTQGRYNYSGSWENAKRSGQGTTFFRNGDVHEGSYSEDKSEGRGNIRYFSGNFFSGFFSSGQRHGTGKLTYSDGSTRDGEWKSDKLDGFVFFRSANNSEANIERWESGKRKSDGATEFQEIEKLEIQAAVVKKSELKVSETQARQLDISSSSDPSKLGPSFFPQPFQFTRSSKKKEFSFLHSRQAVENETFEHQKNISQEIKRSEAKALKLQFDILHS